jgi:hypothetical protein
MISTFVALTLFPTAATPDLAGWKLLDDASHRAFNYFAERSNPVTGFTKDRSANFTEQDNPEHFVASIASIGFALSAYSVGAHRGWMKREVAIRKARNTVRHMIDLATKSH